MTLYVSMSDCPNYQTKYATDVHRAKAEVFVNSDDTDITKMAVKRLNKENRVKDERFAKNTNRIMNSVPFIAVASGLLTKKGLPASLKQGIGWGLALLAPKVVDSVADKATKSNPKLKQAENKHPGFSFIGGLIASVGVFLGASALFDKVAANPKVQEVSHNVINEIESKAEDIKKLLPESKKMAELKSKVKVPEFAKPTMEKMANSETLKNVSKFAKNVGKDVIAHAPWLAVLGVGAALVGKTLSQGNNLAQTKNNIKNEQFDTAKDLMNIYSEENAELKNELKKI